MHFVTKDLETSSEEPDLMLNETLDCREKAGWAGKGVRGEHNGVLPAGTAQEGSMREFMRHPVEMPAGVRIQRSGGQTTAAYLLNVSAGGMTVSLDKPLTVGQDICLLMPVLWPEYNAVGSVVWCTDEDNAYQIGISFDQADEEFKAQKQKVLAA